MSQLQQRLRIRMILIAVLLTTRAYCFNYQFKTIGTQDGLSCHSVTDICQDEKSRIWIGTLDGLNCYSGNRINVYNNFTNGNVDYGYMEARKIIPDYRGHLFIVTRKGLYCFSLKTERCNMIPAESPSSACLYDKTLLIVSRRRLLTYDIASGKITMPYPNLLLPETGLQMVCDKKGNVWLAGDKAGLYMYSKGKFMKKLFPQHKIANLYVSPTGNIWVGVQGNSVFCVNPSGDILSQYSLPSNGNSDRARAICHDNLGNIWVGSRNGLSCINTRTHKIEHYKADPYHGGQLNNASVTSLYTDNQGLVWVGTYWGGVNYFFPGQQRYEYYNTANTPTLSFNVIGKMIEDKNGYIWIGTEGGGLYRYSPILKALKSQPASLSSDYIKDIAYDRQNASLWIASDYSNLINCFDITSSQNKTFPIQPQYSKGIGRALFAVENGKDNLYIASTSSVLCWNKHTHKSKLIYWCPDLFTHNYNSLLLDHRGALWFGSNDGIVSYNTVTHKMQVHRIRGDVPMRSYKELVYTLAESTSEEILLGTHNKGLYTLDRKNNCFVPKYSSLVIGGDNVKALATTAQGQWLIGTERGLTCIEQDSNTQNHPTYEHDLPIKTVNRSAVCVAHDGTIYLGGPAGLVVLKRGSLHSSSQPYSLQFTDLYVNEQHVHPGDSTGILNSALPFINHITLESSCHVFSIVYGTNNFFHEANDKVEYRLLGYNDKWNESRNGNEISFTNLSPGNYTLQVRLKDSPKIQKALAITIEPPLYATWWAKTIYVLLFIILLLLAMKEYKNRLSLKTSLELEHRNKLQTIKLNRQKMEFFTNISHEIRTPATLILGQLEILLRRQDLSPIIREKITAVKRNADSLKILVNKILDFRKLEQGHEQLHLVKKPLTALVSEHISTFRETASLRQITLSFKSPSALSPVMHDPDQIGKVLNNLLSNALKYTPDHGHITASLNEDVDHVYLQVSDNGIGIAPEECRKLFSRFYQSSNALHKEGTGIGLALCKSIMELHHGQIKVESNVGQGTTFTVIFRKGDIDTEKCNLNQEPNPSTTVHPEEPIEKNFKIAAAPEIHILIIEDNDEMRSMLVEIFTRYYTVDSACNGEEGLTKLKSKEYDMIISDIIMPKVSGRELCENVKSDLMTSHIPVVLLTALSSPQQEMAGLRHGADLYISKPFNIQKLLLQCNNFLQTRKAARQRFAKTDLLQVNDITTNDLDKNILDECIQVVMKNLSREGFSVEDFASQINVSRTVLFRKIRAITGVTPHAFIISIRMKEAARLLKQNHGLSISDVSYQVGFSNPQYFTKCFKKQFDCSPSEYRYK